MEMLELLDNAEDSFLEGIKLLLKDNEELDGDECEVGDLIFEIADSEVPIYYYDILSVAQSDVGLATQEPEMECKTAIGCITTNIFAHIHEHLETEKYQLIEKAKEKEE